MNLLTSELQETQRSVENLLPAIQQGIITSSTKTRLEELEMKADELKLQISKEQLISIHLKQNSNAAAGNLFHLDAQVYQAFHVLM